MDALEVLLWRFDCCDWPTTAAGVFGLAGLLPFLFARLSTVTVPVVDSPAMARFRENVSEHEEGKEDVFGLLAGSPLRAATA